MSVYTPRQLNASGAVFFAFTTNFVTPQANQSIKAAPGAGLSIYITDLVLVNGLGAGTIRLYSGVDTGLNTNDVLSSMYFAAGERLTMNLSAPIKLAANSALSIYSLGIGNHNVIVNGYTAAT